jgi:hypothetical protein
MTAAASPPLPNFAAAAGELRQQEIARICNVDPSTISRLR